MRADRRGEVPFSRRAIGIVSSLVLLAACGGPAPSPTPTSAPLGGILRIGIIPSDESPEEIIRLGLDPGGPPEPRFHWFRRCCTARTLLTYDVATSAAGGTELVPDLATALPTVSADGLVWTFTLRSGLHYAPPFEDVEIRAEDIVRSIERASAGEIPPIPAIEGLDAFRTDPARGLAGLETPDPHTLVVRLTHADGDFPHRVARTATSPLPAGALDSGELTDFVSSGPYMVESVGAEGAVLVRNPSWSRSSDPLRPALVDRIEAVAVESEAAGQEMVAAGRLDFITEFLLPRDYRRALRQGEGERIIGSGANAAFFVPLNVANPPFDDVHARRALALLLDRRSLVDGMETGRGSLFEVAHHIIPDLALDGLLAGYDPLAAAGESGSVSAARAEMRKSRYDTDGDGRCDASVCEQVVILGLFESREAERIAVQLRDIGIRAVARESQAFPPDPSTYHMLAIVGWFTEGQIPSEFGVLWSSAGIPDPNYTLLGASRSELRDWGYRGSVPSLDAEIQLCVEHRGSSAFQCWALVDQLVTEQIVAMVPIATALAAYRFSDRVRSVEMSPDLVPALESIQITDDAAPSG